MCSPGLQVDFFYWEAGKFCRETAAAVLELKAAGVAVARACAALRGTPLVSIERKRLYDLADFDTRQAQHQVGRPGPGVSAGASLLAVKRLPALPGLPALLQEAQNTACYLCLLSGGGGRS